MREMNVSIVIEAINKATGPIRSVIKDMQKVRDATDRAGQLNVLRNATSDVRNNIGAVTKEVGRLTKGIAAATAVGGFLFKQQFIDTASAFQDLEVTFNALEGSSEAGRKAMEWVFDFATKTPLSLQGAVEAFKSAKKFGIDPMSGSLQSLMDFNAKMGGGQQELEGIILAVGQAWTKQKLQGEEALQLIERGVPVWDLLSKATGESAAKLQEMSSKGKLGRDVIKQLIDLMGKDAQGAGLALTRTWSGMISNLGVHWTRFKLTVMQNGLFDWLNARLEKLLATLDEMAASGRLNEIAKQFGEKLKTGFIAAWNAAVMLWNGIKQGLKTLDNLFTSLSNITGLDKTTLALTAIAAVITGPLILSMLGLFGSLAKLGLLLGAFAGWWVLIPVAVGAAAVLVMKHWEPISQFFADLWEGVKQTFADVLEWITRKIEWVSQQIERITGMASKVTDTAKEIGGKVAEKAREIGDSVSDKATAAATSVYKFFAGDQLGPVSPPVNGPAQATKVGGEINLIVTADKGSNVRVQQIRNDNDNVDLGVTMAGAN